MALDSADALCKFKNVFDEKQWKRHKLQYVSEQIVNYNKDSFAHDNVDFAIKNGKKLPSRLTAYMVVFAYDFYWFVRRNTGKILRILKIIK